MTRGALVAALWLAVAAVSVPAPRAQTPRAAPAAGAPSFEDVTRAVGIVAPHTNGASAEKYLAETMGSGAAFLDFDGDGWVDVFLVDGGSIADPRWRPAPGTGSIATPGAASFVDVTAASGIRDGRLRHGRVRRRHRQRRPHGPVRDELRRQHALPQRRERASRMSPGRPVWACRCGARAAPSSTRTATATWTCSWPTTWTRRGPTTSSAGTPSGGSASTAIR